MDVCRVVSPRHIEQDHQNLNSFGSSPLQPASPLYAPRRRLASTQNMDFNLNASPGHRSSQDGSFIQSKCSHQCLFVVDLCNFPLFGGIMQPVGFDDWIFSSVDF
ncbi:hypothetical protein Tsp_10332 [Trichinella spiralis]|uniref:hypothetical protein n=1 Tax=Trichinella spiralis TaxID=6334 RepID=UPI0001EFE37D|nr:hypothetical protein Tsp_10332 [Trichinella spiralis]